MTQPDINAAASRARAGADEFSEVFNRVKSQVSKLIVGQEDVIDGVLTALMCGGHVLLEGVPGLGKTMLVKSLGEALNLKFSRIQFTPDMMPADIQGTMVLMETEGGGHELTFQQGPLIANLVLADEINRATPKTQSALLEAMQERQVTVGRRTIVLDEPYSVMATQNPVEQEGTYPLPEAQLDRFLFKQVVSYPQEEEYGPILERTTGEHDVVIEPVADAATIVRLRTVARAVAVPEVSQRYAVRLVMGTQPGSDYAPDSVGAYVSLGSSPRGAQGLILAAKVRALLAGRFAVSTDDIRAMALPVLRHRILVNFHAQANRVAPDQLVEDVLEAVQPPHTAS